MAGPMGRGPGRGRDFSEKQKPKDRCIGLQTYDENQRTE